MSKHAAPMSNRTVYIESAYCDMFGVDTPERNGKHRAVESFNPMTGITNQFGEAA